MSEVKHAPLWYLPAFPAEGRLQAEAVKRRRQQRAREWTPSTWPRPCETSMRCGKRSMPRLMR